MDYGQDTQILLRKYAEYNALHRSVFGFLYGWNKPRILNVSGLRIHSLPELPDDLEYLNCSFTGVCSIPALPKTLKGLKCFSMQLSHLPPLPEGLEFLNCDNTFMKVIPKLPKSLKKLGCSITSITWLPELPPELEVLLCNKTYLTMLPELPPTLKVLECGRNALPIHPKPRESIQHYNKRLEAYRCTERMQRTVMRTKRFKQELIAATWHPDRFERWCLDEEEKKENMQLFA
jgi:hypothetical protein